MLEKYFPNLYGWLVWGGGLLMLHRIFRIVLRIIEVLVWFGFGMLISYLLK